MKIEPYLYFHGTCEEAMNFYARVLGGTVDFNRFAGSPMAEHNGPQWAEKIMHATLVADGATIMGSDGQPGSPPDGQDDVVLSLGFDDAAQAERIFNELAGGGTIGMPFQAVFWGGKFGTLTDRFGIQWMVTGGHS